MKRWAYNLYSDESLMRSYGKGEALAFEVLYRRYKRPLYLFLLRQTNQRSVCEELAHDAWMAVIRGAEVYESTAKFKTWLFRIAHNRLVDYWRRAEHRFHTHCLQEEVSHQLESGERAEDTLVLKDLVAHLSALSEVQAETLLLKIEGFSYQEIAQITAAKPETVKSRLRYASRQLKVSMEGMQ